MEMTPIYNYTDYRTFLKDYIEGQKAQRSTYSLGMWSKKMGISSTAVLVNVINGKRNPGPELQEKFVSYFKFAGPEAEYFKDLIKLSKIKEDPRLSLSLMEKMGKANPNGEFKLLDDRTFSLISKWYYYALKEFALQKGFKEDPQWIADHLEYEVSPKDIKKAIDDLLQLGIFVRNKKGDLKVVHKNLKSTNDIASEGLKRFHEQSLENAKVSLRKHDIMERDISARVMNIREENIPKLKAYLKDFRDKVSDLFEEVDSTSKVYQINIQLIPLTKSIIGDSNEN